MKDEVQQTHYATCWQDRKHHACAVREIIRLRQKLVNNGVCPDCDGYPSECDCEDQGEERERV